MTNEEYLANQYKHNRIGFIDQMLPIVKFRTFLCIAGATIIYHSKYSRLFFQEDQFLLHLFPELKPIVEKHGGDTTQYNWWKGTGYGKDPEIRITVLKELRETIKLIEDE